MPCQIYFQFFNYWCHSRTKLNFCIFSINFMQLKFCSVQKKLSRCTRKIENCVKLASIQNKWHLLFLNNAPKKLQWYQISYEFAFVLIFLSVFIAFFSLIFIYLAMFAITYIQIIPFEIDCAIFYTSLHELFYQFISWTNWVNLWTIAEYHVKLWLIWKKFKTIP